MGSRQSRSPVGVRVSGDMLLQGGEGDVWPLVDRDRRGGAFYPIGPNGPGQGFAPYAWDDFPWDSKKPWWYGERRWPTLLEAVTRATGVVVNPAIRTGWVHEVRGEPRPLPLWVSDPQLLGRVPGPTVSLVPAGFRLPASQVWATVMTHALWWGRGGFLFVETADGTPTPGSVMPVNPWMVDVGDDGRIVLDPGGDDPVSTDFDGRFTAGGVRWRVMMVRGMAPNDGTTAEGVLVRHFDTLKLGATISTYAGSVYHSGVPSGFLQVTAPDVTEDEVKALKAKWAEAIGGGTRETAVLNATTMYHPVAISPVDAALDKQQQANLVAVAHAFQMSAGWLDASAGNSLTYSNMSDRRRDLVDNTVTAVAQPFMEVLSACLAYGSRLRVNWADYTAGAPEEQIPVLVQAVQSGLMSVDEARSLLGLPSRVEGDGDAGVG